MFQPSSHLEPSRLGLAKTKEIQQNWTRLQKIDI